MRNLVFALLLCLPLGICNAQTTTTKPAEPAAIGVVYHLDASSQELKKLPDEQWKELPGPWCCTFEVAGENSSFRVKAGEKNEFVFKTGSPEKVALYRFIQKGKKRRFATTKKFGS